MNLKPEFCVPNAPHFWANTADQEEAKLIRSMSDNLQAMQNQCANLVADVALFDFCLQNPQAHLKEWQFLAGRDGAMALRNFKEALAAVRGLIGRCPSVSRSIDAPSLKMAEQAFGAKFPRVEKLRHAAAHPEHYANPDIQMATYEPILKSGANLGAGVTVQGSLFDRTFLSTINGLTVEWEVSGASALALIQITKDAFSAFDDLNPLKQLKTDGQPDPS